MFDHLGVKLVCLLVATLLWVQVASNEEIDDVVRLPLQIAGLPDSLTVQRSVLPETVGVRVKGNRLSVLLSDLVQRDLGRVELDLSDRGPGRHAYEVTVLDVNVNATPIEIVPATTLEIPVERLLRRMVPVRLVTEGKLPDDYSLAGRPEITPERVEVTGPESIVAALEQIPTVPVRLARRRESFTERVSLAPAQGDLRLLPVEVEVAVGIDAIVERVFENIPVTVWSDLASERIHLEPTIARVRVVGAAGVVGSMGPEEISVLVHIEAGVSGVAQIPGQVVVPDGVASSSLEPVSFQVIVDGGASPVEGGR